MQEQQKFTLQEYRAKAFRKIQFKVIICSVFELFSFIGFYLGFMGDIDKKFILPCFLVFCIFFGFQIYNLICYFKDINEFKN